MRAILALLLLASPSLPRAAAERRALDAAEVRRIEKPRILASRYDEASRSWRVDLAGVTAGGCGILRVVVPSPDGKVTWKDREIKGGNVGIDRCIAAWSAETHDAPRAEKSEDPVEAASATPAPHETKAAADDEMPVIADEDLPVIADEGIATPTPRPSAAATTRPVAVAAKATLAPVGVPECDAFLDAYARCIDEKMPAGSREGAREGLAALRDVWREAAARSAEARTQLPATCTKTRADTQARVASFGCALQ